MNTGNTCAGLEIKHINAEAPFAYMYSLQYKLQARLGKLPPANTSAAEATSEIIYWNYCIQDECVELLNWLEIPGAKFIELEMEVIDILHFAMNIGIALKLSEAEVQEFACGFTWLVGNRPIDYEELCAYTQGLMISITKLINQLPWKSWKTYSPEADGREFAAQNFAQVLYSIFTLACRLGMDEQKVINYYCAKNLENHARQDRGY